MAYQNLGTVAWDSKPNITAVIAYDYRRNGADMQYKVRITVNKLPTTISTFGYPIYADITLDSVKAVSKHTIKNASPNYWTDPYVYETDWLTVSKKSIGTTTLSVRLYSIYGSDAAGTGTRDESYAYQLTVAPGASVPTLSKSGMFLGETLRVQTNSVNSQFFHEIWYTFGGHTGFAEDFDGTSGTEGIYNWADLTPRLDLAAYLPNATSGTCTVYLRTYTDRTKTTRVGEDQSASFTLHIPQDMVPVASLALRVVNDNSVIDGWGVCVKGYSRLAYEVTAGGAYGSYIQSCQLSFAGKTVMGLSGMVEVNQAGSFTPSIKVTDSRGRSVTVTGEEITVFDYSEPTIGQLTVQRCDANGVVDNEGAYIRVQGTFAPGASIDGHNRVTTVCRYRQIGGSWSSNTTVVDAGTVIGGGIPATKTYEAEITVTDAVGGSKTVSVIIPTAEVAFHLREGGKGAAFGKYAEKDALECAWDVEIKGKPLLDWIYPVGAIYLSINEANPAALFGGTWERIKDTFLLAAGDAYEAGCTGGEAVHTLTTDEMPAHSHQNDISTSYSNFPPARESTTTGWRTVAYKAAAGNKTLNTGGDQPHNNMPPYLAVYIWKRMA